MIMNNKKIFYNSIIVAVLFSFYTYSQDCGPDYTYFGEIPPNVLNNVNDNKAIMRTGASTLADGRIHGMSFPIALVATDYVELYVRQHGGSTSTCLANFCYFGGMKLIGI